MGNRVIVVHIHQRPVKSSRHVKAEQKLEVRLQLLCGLIAISYTVPLPIFASNIQSECVAVDNILFVKHSQSCMETHKPCVCAKSISDTQSLEL